MERRQMSVVLLVLMLGAGGAANGARDVLSPVGTWKTVDDNTGRPRSLVRVHEEDGKLFGRIEQNLTPGDEGRTCTKCTDERKDRPLVGMVFMRNLKLVDGEYRDGDILDPDNGVTYRCKLKPEDGGRKLKVRGFVGVSLFGRSQTWERQQ